LRLHHLWKHCGSKRVRKTSRARAWRARPKKTVSLSSAYVRGTPPHHQCRGGQAFSPIISHREYKSIRRSEFPPSPFNSWRDCTSKS
jgi:hypothetical protein